MPSFVACKLPNGLSISHNGQTINLIGANGNWDPATSPAAPPPNGTQPDSQVMASGYGITQLTDDQTAAFEDWRDRSMYHVKDGKPDKDNRLSEPFPAFDNGLILGPFKSDADARSEARKATQKYDPFLTGMDGDREIKEAVDSSGQNLVPEKGISARTGK